MFFGGVTGSAVAEVSSIGAMMIPAMEKDGYSRRFATAIVLTAATMGPIIPPSIGMIVFAHVAGKEEGHYLAPAVLELLVAASPARQDQMDVLGLVTLPRDIDAGSKFAHALQRGPAKDGPIPGRTPHELL